MIRNGRSRRWTDGGPQPPADARQGLPGWGWGIAGGAIALFTDLVSTGWVLRHLPARRVETLPGGFVELRMAFNTGASFGIGAGHEPVVAVLEAVALAVVVVLVVRAPTPLIGFFLGGAAGGGCGNLVDRVFGPHGSHPGAVVDWIHVVGYPPVFNLADLSLRVGLIVAAGALLVRTRHARAAG